jgi:hypothetical protein
LEYLVFSEKRETSNLFSCQPYDAQGDFPWVFLLLLDNIPSVSIKMKEEAHMRSLYPHLKRWRDPCHDRLVLEM